VEHVEKYTLTLCYFELELVMESHPCNGVLGTVRLNALVHGFDLFHCRFLRPFLRRKKEIPRTRFISFAHRNNKRFSTHSQLLCGHKILIESFDGVRLWDLITNGLESCRSANVQFSPMREEATLVNIFTCVAGHHSFCDL